LNLRDSRQQFVALAPSVLATAVIQPGHAQLSRG